jgi:hypothetical protein
VPGMGAPPSSFASAVVRLMAEQAVRRWTIAQILRGLEGRGWPRADLESVVIELVAEGVILSLDRGGFTIHAYGNHG